MKTWPLLFALIVAGACGAHVAEDLAKARSSFESDNGGARFGLDDLTSGYGSRMKQLVQGGFLAQRYELVATLSTRSHCLAIKAEGEARTLVDQFGIHWCSSADALTPSQPGSQRALAKIQVSTQMLRIPYARSRGTC